MESGGVLPETKLNQGAFTFVKEVVAGAAANAASWQAPGITSTDPSFVLSGYPSGTYDIMFYDSTNSHECCDFYLVTSDGHRVGGLHDFTAGCRGFSYNAPTGGDYALLANDVVFMNGPKGGLVGVAGQSLILTDNSEEIIFEEEVSLNYYFNLEKNVWSLYTTDGSTGLQLANWGHFVLVPYNPLTPNQVTLPAGGLPSTTPQSH